MWYAALFCIVFLIDQITKILVAFYSGAAGTVEGSVHVKWLIKDFLEISYSENKNGMMSVFSAIADEKVRYAIFMISTVVICVGIILYLTFAKNKGKWNTFALTLVLAGAAGNFADRAIFVYVRDFIHVVLFGDIFPYIFNVADSAVVVGAIMLVIGILFLGDDAVLKFKKKKPEDDGDKEV